MTYVVIAHSLPRYCPICKGDELIDLCRTDGTFIARVPCPHCTGISNLPVLIATAGASA